MVTHIHRDDLLVLNQQLQCDAVRQVDPELGQVPLQISTNERFPPSAPDRQGLPDQSDALAPPTGLPANEPMWFYPLGVAPAAPPQETAGG